MKNLMFLTLLAVAATGCQAQPKQHEKSVVTTNAAADNHKPQSGWKVHKRYDDKGKLIAYDSVYTWSYSGNGITRNSTTDSVWSAFRNQMDATFSSFFSNSFADPLAADSLLYQGFAQPGYFRKKWESHYSGIRKQMLQMDSVRNSLLQQRYPDPEQAPGTIL